MNANAPAGLRGWWRPPGVQAAAWEPAALLALLGGAAVLFMWNLSASGWANAYYSAAVMAGARDWTAFLFGSFDASNAITVDKTPAALWVMALSVRIFGFSSWSVLLPQAVAGVAAVWLLYLTVRRTAGPTGGLLAGAVLALTPVATLMFRFNNPDALLTLLLVGAAYATVRALEVASTRWLVLAGAAIGFAFLTKMLQGFLVIPAFAMVYLLAAPTTIWRRIWQVAAAAGAVLLSAGWWVVLVMLWPSAVRPYIGGSQTNSIIELILGYNGLGRLTGEEVGRVGGGGAGPFSEGAGWLRLFQGELASQVSWLLPVALMALVAVLWARRGAPRTDLTRAHALLWGGWLVTTGLVFSLMQGIFHSYYAVALVPPIGALLGMGVAEGWRHWDRREVRAAMAAILAMSAAWTAVLLSRSPDWNPWLMPVVVAATLATGVALLFGSDRWRAARFATIGAGSVALLMASAVGSIATAAQPHTGAIPTAQPTVQDSAGARGGPGGFANGRARFNGGGGVRGFQFGPPPGGQNGALGPAGQLPGGGDGVARRGPGGNGGIGGLLDAAQTQPELVAALRSNASAYRWVAATTGSNNAAGLALSTGEAVMGIGGFNGSDPSPTLAEFQAYVAAGDIHYYIAGNDAAGFRGTRGGSAAAAEINAWVAANFAPTTIGGITVYDVSHSS
ncbi:MAG: glycosyltransferase family 39 protein [Chloroflexota bacterium]|nr:glycosyltransferase family 39 protein [Chloroflexota bacterium]